MSLAVLANDMASRGRGQDSMLVHMTPREVAGLQALAMKHGGSLTINPETGLPEAGFLSSILPALAGFALNAFAPGLGTAVGGALGLGAAAGTGIAVGGLTALATGSLSRGLMAGMGAYGGAGLSEGLMGAGASAGAGQTLAAEAAANAAQEGIALPSNYAEMAAKTATPDQIAAARAASTPADLMSAGAKAAAADPTGFLKSTWKPLAAAAAPIMADAMVPTTTKAPVQDTGNIRKFSYDPYGQTYTPLGIYPAAGYKGMAGGGIVALADGGVPGYADGMLVGDQDVFNYFKGLDQSKLASGALDSQIAADMQKYNVSAADIARITGTQANQGDYEKRFVQAIAKPDTSAQEFMAMTSDVGLQNQALANAMQNADMSASAQYALTHPLDDAATKYDTASDLGFYKNLGYTAGSAPGDQGGLEGLYANINYAAKGLQNQISAGNMTGQQAREAALTEMNRIGMSAADLKAATGKSLAELFPDTIKKTTTTTTTGGTDTGTIAGGTKLDTATTYDNGAFGNYGSGNKTGVDYKGDTVSIATPGDIITNPDQTRTVTPNLPGRPYGGFTGIEALKSAYTAGGGSLGQNNLFVPKTVDEMYARYGNTGGSKQAYDFLMGKGAVDIKKPYTPTGELFKPYTESVMGMPTNLSTKKFIFKDGKYVANPDYRPLSYDSKGNRIVGASDAEISKVASSGGTGFQAMVDAGSVTYEQIAAALGITVDEAKKKYPKATPVAEAGSSSQQISDGLAAGGVTGYAVGGGLGSLGSYSDGGRLLKGPGDGVSDSIPATIGAKGQPARLADGEFVVPARIVSELGNGSTDAGAKKLYAMMDRVQRARGKTTGKNKVAANSRADKYLPA